MKMMKIIENEGFGVKLTQTVTNKWHDRARLPLTHSSMAYIIGKVLNHYWAKNDEI